MSYEFYKVLHVFAALLLFTSLGTYAATCRSQGERLRRLSAVAHGVSLTILFVAGFGLMARLGMFGEIATWVWLKIGLWLVLALATTLMRRKPEWAISVWLSVPVLGGLAVWLAVFKPF
jgi:uncharacterized membrane protein SirB2